MNHPGPPAAATWLLRLFVAAPDREVLLGDLIEEHTLMVSALGPDGRRRHSAAQWYWSQVLRSVAPLVRANIRRGLWLKTLGAMLLGYLVLAVIVIVGDIVMTRLLPARSQTYAILSVGVAVPATMLGGYLAACLRPGAVLALAVFSALMAVVSLVSAGDAEPLWYQVCMVCALPAGSWAGGQIRLRRKDGDHQ